MQDPNVRDRTSQSSPSWKIIAGLATVVVLVGGGTALWTLNSVDTPSQPTPTTPDDPAESPIPQGSTVQAYGVEDTGTSFRLVPIAAPTNSTEPVEQLKDSFNYLLTAEQLEEGVSTIPPGTRLLDLTIESDGVHVNLSQEFTQGGGSVSMMGRLGQVVYTASSLDPAAPVWISVDGEPLEVLGGEGILVDQPTSRAAIGDTF